MSIRLRVAGIYFDEEIDFELVKQQVGAFNLPGRTLPTLDLEGNPAPADSITILELMEAARKKRALQDPSRPFTYAFDRRFRQNRDGSNVGFLSMISIGHELGSTIFPSLGNQKRPAGFYSLTETTIPNGVVAWQNYVIRDGKPVSSVNRIDVSPPNPGVARSGFTTFDQAVLKDKDTVVWRMVAIRRLPDPKETPEAAEKPPMKA